MVEKIGRNNLCPCMSGKKYKKCCLKTGIWENFKRQNLSYYNEEFYFEILNKDSKFRNLYLSARNIINKQLLCCKADYNIGAAASYGHVEDIAYTILSESIIKRGITMPLFWRQIT